MKAEEELRLRLRTILEGTPLTRSQVVIAIELIVREFKALMRWFLMQADGLQQKIEEYERKRT